MMHGNALASVFYPQSLSPGLPRWSPSEVSVVHFASHRGASLTLTTTENVTCPPLTATAHFSLYFICIYAHITRIFSPK